MTLVSIVIPTHNRARHLPLAVESALGQTHPEVEVVVVDDGSTDETPRLLEAMTRKEPRLRVIRHQESHGAPKARNAGVVAARGEVVGFLDDDCVYHPEKVQRQLRQLSPSRSVAYCQQVIRQVEGGWEVEGREGAGTKPLEGLLNIGTNTLLISKDIFLRVGGFDEELPRLQDWELLLRLSRVTGFAFIPEILVQGVMVRGGITLTPGPLKAAASRIVGQHSPHLTQKERSLLFFILGKFLLVDGLSGDARRLMASALKTNPASVRAWAGLAASLLGPGPARIVRRWGRDKRAADAVERWAINPVGPMDESAASP
jgi:hypothetical protein